MMVMDVDDRGEATFRSGVEEEGKIWFILGKGFHFANNVLID